MASVLEGLDFCRKVYELLDQVGREPDGIARLRLRPRGIEKRLIEELIPIALTCRPAIERPSYQSALAQRVAAYDAILWSSGALVEQRRFRRKVFVEVTTSVHQNEYLARRLLHERGGSFGLKGISRDKKTGAIFRSLTYTATMNSQQT